MTDLYFNIITTKPGCKGMIIWSTGNIPCINQSILDILMKTSSAWLSNIPKLMRFPKSRRHTIYSLVLYMEVQSSKAILNWISGFSLRFASIQYAGSSCLQNFCAAFPIKNSDFRSWHKPFEAERILYLIVFISIFHILSSLSGWTASASVPSMDSTLFTIDSSKIRRNSGRRTYWAPLSTFVDKMGLTMYISFRLLSDGGFANNKKGWKQFWRTSSPYTLWPLVSRPLPSTVSRLTVESHWWGERVPVQRQILDHWVDIFAWRNLFGESANRLRLFYIPLFLLYVFVFSSFLFALISQLLQMLLMYSRVIASLDVMHANLGVEWVRLVHIRHYLINSTETEDIKFVGGFKNSVPISVRSSICQRRSESEVCLRKSPTIETWSILNSCFAVWL